MEILIIDPVELGGNIRPYVLKQALISKMHVCLSTCDLLLQLYIKGLKFITDRLT